MACDRFILCGRIFNDVTSTRFYGRTHRSISRKPGITEKDDNYVCDIILDLGFRACRAGSHKESLALVNMFRSTSLCPLPTLLISVKICVQLNMRKKSSFHTVSLLAVPHNMEHRPWNTVHGVAHIFLACEYTN